MYVNFKFVSLLYKLIVCTVWNTYHLCSWVIVRSNLNVCMYMYVCMYVCRGVMSARRCLWRKMISR